MQLLCFRHVPQLGVHAQKHVSNQPFRCPHDTIAVHKGHLNVDLHNRDGTPLNEKRIERGGESGKVKQTVKKDDRGVTVAVATVTGGKA